ncbi:carbamoyltransferase N-terminal domain-containing protein [Anaerolineales bacterium HSG6]|nr:carbamoyltransferase N-terminal domain-containing protein [Anaerolineales bacterium HSG6]
MNILGISCFYHDAAAALLVDGEVVAASEEERFTRKKHDSSFPEQSINFCLNHAGLTVKDLDYVVFYEKPLLKLGRILQTTMSTFPQSWGVFRESMVTWFDEKLWIKSKLQTGIGIPTEKILFVEHHLSHAASSMFCSPFKEAAVMTIDGVGEWTTAAIGKATADWDGTGINHISLDHELRFPHSLGLLYSAFTAYLGFRVNNGEYKVMGMSPYGQPNYMDEIYKVVNVDSEGGISLNMDYFSFHHSTKSTFSPKFEELFGPRRMPESEFFSLTTHPNRDHPDWDNETAKQNQKYADIATSIQRVTEDTILKMAVTAQQKSGSKNLVMAGGVALNSAANGRLMREGPFERVYIQPAAGDAGGAVGAALYAYHVVFGKPRKFVMEHAYWGAEYPESDMVTAIKNSGFPYEQIDDDDKLLDKAVDTILSQKVISWYRGRFEWGPRALGHRSIIADPRSEEIKEIVNTKIKFREPFRPFAPVIMEEHASEYFTNPNLDDQYPPRYMLMVSPIAEDKQDKIKAVCHMGTGRLQSVREEWNSGYYNLIKKFNEATGVPILLNTSYNLRGEPMVTTPQHAINTFAASDIDQLVMGQFLVSKPEGYVSSGSHLTADQVD